MSLTLLGKHSAPPLAGAEHAALRPKRSAYLTCLSSRPSAAAQAQSPASLSRPSDSGAGVQAARAAQWAPMERRPEARWAARPRPVAAGEPFPSAEPRLDAAVGRALARARLGAAGRPKPAGSEQPPGCETRSVRASPPAQRAFEPGAGPVADTRGTAPRRPGLELRRQPARARSSRSAAAARFEW